MLTCLRDKMEMLKTDALLASRMPPCRCEEKGDGLATRTVTRVWIEGMKS